jgi:predicted ABC-class ATPase
VPDSGDLRSLLQRIDGRSYPAYKALVGRWRLGDVEVQIDHVQGDPFAAPSRLRVWVRTGIGAATQSDAVCRRAAEDWLLRRFGRDLRGRKRGSGRSGELRVYTPGPEIVRRSAVMLHPDGRAEVRFTLGLPAAGRRVRGREAYGSLVEDIPAAALAISEIQEEPGLLRHIASVRDQDALRCGLHESGLVAFIANGSVLPRRSGIDAAPLSGAIPFESPLTLRVTLETPSGPVSGMGVRAGVTLLTGGGFHGKSTVLQAIQWGHLDHVPGDGRERVVSVLDTVKVRAEDGRSVTGVDISPFLGDLPGGVQTRPFSTDDASGSTSQAAAIVESIESGARLLLFDEDTSATNLMVRDARMAALIAEDGEPITPLVGRIRQLHESLGVSSILVVGGVGDYLAVADCVVVMNHWRAIEATARAKELAGPLPPPPTPLLAPIRRVIDGRSLAPTGKGRVRARDERRIDHGSEEIDLTAVEQVLDGPHAATLGHALRVLAEGGADDRRGVPEVLDALDTLLDREGLDALSPYPEPVGALVWPRRHEVAAALARLRTLRVRSETP